MVTVDDMLVDALAAEVLQDLVDAVYAVQDRLEGSRGPQRTPLVNTKLTTSWF